ncbi:hypothetical protein AVEN_209820-1 [Araneus ventricosus]|uniref:Uncharacterized protein n=1 Tax=Araneus ventricosus TaxID=182803 RepID=A0A4Y2WJS2_ARAVE|nr:hypothetical protein AVEN_209820-1 [Araneus ventricosus]
MSSCRISKQELAPPVGIAMVGLKVPPPEKVRIVLPPGENSWTGLPSSSPPFPRNSRNDVIIGHSQVEERFRGHDSCERISFTTKEYGSWKSEEYLDIYTYTVEISSAACGTDSTLAMDGNGKERSHHRQDERRELLSFHSSLAPWNQLVHWECHFQLNSSA